LRLSNPATAKPTAGVCDTSNIDTQFPYCTSQLKNYIIAYYLLRYA
jgi:hypothetical protein